MRGAEAVKEVKERKTCLDGGKVCYGGQIHALLYARGSKQAETGLAGTHYVMMVAEY